MSTVGVIIGFVAVVIAGVLGAVIGPIVTRWVEHESPDLNVAFEAYQGANFFISGTGGKLQIRFEPGKRRS